MAIKLSKLKILAENIKKLRAQKGYTQLELGYEAECGATTISRYERMEVKAPGVKHMSKIAEALGVTTKFLLTQQGWHDFFREEEGSEKAQVKAPSEKVRFIELFFPRKKEVETKQNLDFDIWGFFKKFSLLKEEEQRSVASLVDEIRP